MLDAPVVVGVGEGQRGAGMLSSVSNLMDRNGELDRAFTTGVGFTFEDMGDVGMCGVCR